MSILSPDNPLMMMGMGFNPIGMPMSNMAAQQNVMRQMAPLRAMAYLNHSGSAVHSGRPSRGAGTNPFNADPQGYMDPSMFNDPEVRGAADGYLKQYGLSLPDAPRQFGILPEGGFFSNHPRLGNMLDAGLFGAAATNGGDTVGENIQNVIQGIGGGRSMRAQAQAAPYTSTFNVAQQLESLRDLGDKHDMNRAMIDWHGAQARKMDQDKYGHPIPVEGGAWVQDSPDQPYRFAEGPGGKAARESMGAGMAAFKARYGEEPAEGGPADKRGLTARQRWGQQYMDWQAQLRTAGPLAGYAGGYRDSDALKDANRQADEHVRKSLIPPTAKASFLMQKFPGAKDLEDARRMAEEYNNSLWTKRSKWGDDYRAGHTDRPFADWAGGDQNTPEPSASPVPGGSKKGGSALSRLMDAADAADKKAATPTPQVPINHFLPAAPAPMPAAPPSSLDRANANADATQDEFGGQMRNLWDWMNTPHNAGIQPNTTSGNNFRVF